MRLFRLITVGSWQLVVGSWFALLIPSAVLAFDTFFASPSAMRMGGAHVLSVRDTSAQYYSPATFRFFAQRDSEGQHLATDNSNMGKMHREIDLVVAGGYRLQENSEKGGVDVIQ